LNILKNKIKFDSELFRGLEVNADMAENIYGIVEKGAQGGEKTASKQKTRRIKHGKMTY
jgi:hypothetical protein